MTGIILKGSFINNSFIGYKMQLHAGIHVTKFLISRFQQIYIDEMFSFIITCLTFYITSTPGGLILMIYGDWRGGGNPMA